MKREGKKIILTDKVANGNACIRLCNIHKGMDTLDVKVIRLEQIVLELCEAYCAISAKDMPNVVDERISEILLNRVLLAGDYHCFPQKSLSKLTVKSIKGVIDELRKNMRTKEFEDAQNQKISELRTIIREYESLLRKEQMADYPFLLDLALEVIEEDKIEMELLLPWTRDACVGELENHVWHAKEKLVIQKLFAACKNVSCFKLKFLNEDITNQGKIHFDFYRAYGIANEISQAIRGIKQTSDTAIYYSDPGYVNFLKAALDEARLPYTFSGGMRVADTDTIQFLKGILHMAGDNFLYSKLEAVIYNPLMTFGNVEEKGEQEKAIRNPGKAYQDSLRDGIGWGHDRMLAWCDAHSEDEQCQKKVYASFLRELVDIFFEADTVTVRSIVRMYRRLLDFMKTYTYSTNPEWMKLRKPLEEQISHLKYLDGLQWSLEEKVDYLAEMLDELTLSDTEGSDGVLLAPINRFFVIERNTVFVIGLAASAFQLETMQSPILSDEEKRRYILGDACPDAQEECWAVDLSANRNAKRKKAVTDALKTMNEGTVTMIYSSYDTITLRENSKSVFFLEMSDGYEIKQAVGYDFSREDLYFDSSEMRNVLAQVDDFVERKRVPRKEWEKPKSTEMSASALQTLLGCPLAYYYKYMKYLVVYEELRKNGYEWLPAAAKGNLCHRTLEQYLEASVTEGGVLKEMPDACLFHQVYSAQIEVSKKEIPYPSLSIRQKEEQHYRSLLYTYIEKLHREWSEAKNDGVEWKIIGCELGFEALPYTDSFEDAYNFTLLLRGSIDRMDGYVDSDGNFKIRLIDYKTGQKQKKEEEVAGGIQIQHYIYAYAALEYVKKHLEEIRRRFGVSEINDIQFEQVAYVFPYQKPSKEPNYDVLDVTEQVNAELITGVGLMEKSLRLPWKLRSVLANTIGALQNGSLDEFQKNCNQMVAEKRESTQEQSLLKFCASNYCKYKPVCREWLG
ncbi:MAG: PD-(D/E)XK nuclease family protein [Clostridiales bacterium]|nr:PD-(D/E)XK nuclease family protein [Clostridiales bacterium]